MPRSELRPVSFGWAAHYERTWAEASKKRLIPHGSALGALRRPQLARTAGQFARNDGRTWLATGFFALLHAVVLFQLIGLNGQLGIGPILPERTPFSQGIDGVWPLS
jgi:hypothetical protein